MTKEDYLASGMYEASLGVTMIASFWTSIRGLHLPLPLSLATISLLPSVTFGRHNLD